MKRLCILLVRLYKKLLSPFKPTCCRFTPSCSAYAIEAFEKRGFFVGFALTLTRILRCNPFFRGGYDPVPHHFPFKRLDLIRKKMGEKEGVCSVFTEPKQKRKGMALLPWKSHHSKK